MSRVRAQRWRKHLHHAVVLAIDGRASAFGSVVTTARAAPTEYSSPVSAVEAVPAGSEATGEDHRPVEVDPRGVGERGFDDLAGEEPMAAQGDDARDHVEEGLAAHNFVMSRPRLCCREPNSSDVPRVESYLRPNNLLRSKFSRPACLPRIPLSPSQNTTRNHNPAASVRRSPHVWSMASQPWHIPSGCSTTRRRVRMAIQRTDIERALDDLISQEEGMRFQGLAVVLGKQRWPELIANERKKDFGLDAYAPPSLTPERVGKGLAGSITATLDKVSTDATTAKENHPDLKVLLFVTPTKVGNPTRRKWAKRILEDHDVELHIVGREDVIAEMMLPANASLCARFLHLTVDSEPDVADLIDRTKRAAGAVTRNWASKTKGHPLIELTAVRLDPTGAESADALSLERIDQALSRSGRIVLEGPAGRGKTTTLIQLALRERVAGIPFIVDLSPWTTSRRPILEYIAGMPAFLAEGLTSGHLARVQQTEPFLLLLNGWNEITESSSPQANDALRELERDLPSAGIVVATRTHHLIPPLPGALRLRLLRLWPSQRADYLAARLGVAAAEFRARLAVDPSLDELTRTPFILSEVVSLFEAGAAIPPTKFGVLAQVLRLHEQREEHENSLQAAPISSRQAAYLKALATEMTRRGGVALSDADARAVVASVAGDLMARGQIGPTEAPAVLAALTAHHVLERVDYPGTAFQFEHQQLQEYFAALDVRARLLKLPDGDHEATDRFTARYVNEPAWAEPLRMAAETFAEQTGDEETDNRNVRAGVHLVNMALAVDLVSAGELARLCGPNVWRQVRAVVDERFRAAYALSDGHYRQYAVAAMLATGADDFADIVVPLLSGPDQRTRLRTCRLWPDIHLSSLGPDWREQVGAWSEAARTDFVFELLHHRVDDEIASFAVDDNSAAVKDGGGLRSHMDRVPRRDDPRSRFGGRAHLRNTCARVPRPFAPSLQAAGHRGDAERH